MLHIKSKRIALALFSSALIALCSPAISYAEDTYDTGDIASSRAAEQRAAIAKRKERIKKEKEAEAAKKAAEAQKPAEEQKEKPAAQ